ncbi:unnamed protein product [Trichobilharzia regenti]|nr:unnamed protein product [Trichobilharzia regenti]
MGVRIMIRGRGSMRDQTKEEANIGRPNWEHLNDNLHVLITVEDYENRAKARIEKASEYISLFLEESVKVVSIYWDFFFFLLFFFSLAFVFRV